MFFGTKEEFQFESWRQFVGTKRVNNRKSQSPRRFTACTAHTFIVFGLVGRPCSDDVLSAGRCWFQPTDCFHSGALSLLTDTSFIPNLCCRVTEKTRRFRWDPFSKHAAETVCDTTNLTMNSSELFCPKTPEFSQTTKSLFITVTRISRAPGVDQVRNEITLQPFVENLQR